MVVLGLTPLVTSKDACAAVYVVVHNVSPGPKSAL